MRYALSAYHGPRAAVQGQRSAGDWLSGRALPSHGRGHWFEPSIAHQPTGPVPITELALFIFPASADASPRRTTAVAVRETAATRSSCQPPRRPPAARDATGHSCLADLPGSEHPARQQRTHARQAPAHDRPGSVARTRVDGRARRVVLPAAAQPRQERGGDVAGRAGDPGRRHRLAAVGDHQGRTSGHTGGRGPGHHDPVVSAAIRLGVLRHGAVKPG
jgi:hypothetical protein